MIRAALLSLVLVLRASASGQDEGEPAAPPSPSGLGAKELKKRREALGSWTFEPVAIEGRNSLFQLDRRAGRFSLQDRRTGVKWFSSWGRRGFASVLLQGGAEWIPIDRLEGLTSEETKLRFRGTSSKGGVPYVQFEVECPQGASLLTLRCEVPE